MVYSANVRKSTTGRLDFQPSWFIPMLWRASYSWAPTASAPDPRLEPGLSTLQGHSHCSIRRSHSPAPAPLHRKWWFVLPLLSSSWRDSPLSLQTAGVHSSVAISLSGPLRDEENMWSPQCLAVSWPASAWREHWPICSASRHRVCRNSSHCWCPPGWWSPRCEP